MLASVEEGGTLLAGFLLIGLRLGAGVELAGCDGATCGGLAFPAAALNELRVRGSRPFLVLDADTDVDGGSLRL